ncbi:hypothetical protein CYY_001498 [Polysphondylium violaceum]|uniref:RRM domain-containing protein n=1 Tax=Polysphondylium violaceum TaxID=133409 RepID=A0A8J4V7U9_9MYCE|nr:hypothetical protein CYY_001498 [Polysphondylium violaceum]
MSIKLFVGQIPKSFNEDEIRSMFADINTTIESISLIKNKNNSEPQGCAFVIVPTKEEADKAIETLHNSKKFPGVLNNLQVKYADSEQEKHSSKLFVGMLPKSYDEDQIKDLFKTYGIVEDICILRGPNNESKGCGFIKFDSRDSAQSAINALHTLKLEGSPNNLVVKFADTEKDKKKKQKQLQIQQITRQQQPQFQQQFQQQMPFQPKLNNQPLFVNPYLNIGNPMPSFNFLQSNSTPSLLGTPPMIGDNFYDLYSNPGAFDAKYTPPAMNGTQMYGAGGSNGGRGGYGASANGMAPTGVNGNSGGASKKFQSVGPNGSNLFVYNIPNFYCDNDLLMLFQPFGLVVSAKVYIDKATGISKGFGFVSYDNPQSASFAITSLNGSMMAGKKLKVSLKQQGGHGSQPY